MDFLFSDAEGLSTATSDDQCECEAMCSRFLVDFRSQRPKTLKGMVEAGMVYKREQPIKWKCGICGYIVEGTEPPPKCPSCKNPKEFYEPASMDF